MSDCYNAIVDIEANPSESKDLAEKVVERLVREEIIQSTSDPESILGGEGGYRPGQRVSALYDLWEDEAHLWEGMRTNGMEIETGPWVIYLAPPF